MFSIPRALSIAQTATQKVDSDVAPWWTALSVHTTCSSTNKKTGRRTILSSRLPRSCWSPWLAIISHQLLRSTGQISMRILNVTTHRANGMDYHDESDTDRANSNGIQKSCPFTTWLMRRGLRPWLVLLLVKIQFRPLSLPHTHGGRLVLRVRLSRPLHLAKVLDLEGIWMVFSVKR